jgi:hypothetical protein
MKIKELKSIGIMLYGPTWQACLARSLNKNPRTIRRWVSGEIKTIPAKAQEMLYVILWKRRAEINKTIDSLAVVLDKK